MNLIEYYFQENEIKNSLINCINSLSINFILYKFEVLVVPQVLYKPQSHQLWLLEKRNNSNMENNGESNSRNGSFRVGLGLNEAKVHTIVELFGFDTQSLLLNSVDVNGGGNGEEREKEQKVPTNSLSPRQMKSLVALCDTILPSIKDNVVGSDDDDDVANFYRTSASMAGTPERVGLSLPLTFKVFFFPSSISCCFFFFPSCNFRQLGSHVLIAVLITVVHFLFNNLDSNYLLYDNVNFS